MNSAVSIRRDFTRIALPVGLAFLLVTSNQGRPVTAATPTPTLLPSTTSSHDPILVGAGDIASCTLHGDAETARLIDGVLANVPGKALVFTAGDNAYDTGSTADYQHCYASTWGRFKKITRPTPGNHD